MSRFEIVVTDAEQPWHARAVANNGQIVWHTENYANRVSAHNAVAVAAEAFGITMSRPPALGDPEVHGVGFLGEAPTGHVYCFDVRFVDEREDQSTPVEAAPQPPPPPEPEPPAEEPA